MNFYDRFIELCKEKGVSPSGVAKAIGIGTANATYWKKGSIPSAQTLAKLSDYFGVSADYLLGADSTSHKKRTVLTIDGKIVEEALKNAYNTKHYKIKETPPALTKKDERDIEKILAAARSQLENQEGLMFDGDPASPEAIESILAAMELGLQAAKQRNKEKYTPKNHKEKSPTKE